MWYSELTFQDQQPPLENPIPDDYFTRPVTAEEFAFIQTYVTDGKTFADFPVPPYLGLPAEYEQLLRHANGGLIVNGEREFGYFDAETAREMYVSYAFLLYAPHQLPIAFNGGGVFYAYDFSVDPSAPHLIAVHASCVGDEDEVTFLGNVLVEVLSKDTSIEDET